MCTGIYCEWILLFRSYKQLLEAFVFFLVCLQCGSILLLLLLLPPPVVVVVVVVGVVGVVVVVVIVVFVVVVVILLILHIQEPKHLCFQW